MVLATTQLTLSLSGAAGYTLPVPKNDRRKRMVDQFVKFCRLRLGLKSIIDYAQSRSRLLGIRDLPIRTVFDVGANVGKKARLYRRFFPDAAIYCIEPLSDCCEQLENWAQRQNGKARVFNLALGDEPAETVIYRNRKRTVWSTLLKPANETESRFSAVPVTVETLDRLAAGLDLQDDVFVKIDTEGYDMKVIQGGLETLKRAAAVIIELPLYDAPNGNADFAAYVQIMSELGYMYRGSLSFGYDKGIANATDGVFIRPSKAMKRAA